MPGRLEHVRNRRKIFSVGLERTPNRKHTGPQGGGAAGTVVGEGGYPGTLKEKKKNQWANGNSEKKKKSTTASMASTRTAQIRCMCTQGAGHASGRSERKKGRLGGREAMKPAEAQRFPRWRKNGRKQPKWLPRIRLFWAARSLGPTRNKKTRKNQCTNTRKRTHQRRGIDDGSATAAKWQGI